MIGKLKGVIEQVDPLNNNVLLDVNGVCYLLFCSDNTINNLPKKGEQATINVETHVREDHIHLYGFASISEKKTFNIITKVNGVGTKMAINILSILNAEQIATAIAADDKKAFTRVSGVGPKLATRIINELKDKFDLDISSSNISGVSDGNIASSGFNNDIDDAIKALINLGYNRSDSYVAVNKVVNDNQSASIDILIKDSLKILSG